MTITEMLGQSLILTVLGMGAVFVFLIIMIQAMILVNKIIRAFKLDVEKQDTAVQTQAAPAAASDNSIIAAIAAAVRAKR